MGTRHSLHRDQSREITIKGPLNLSEKCIPIFSDPWVCSVQVQEILDEFDTNNDKAISFDEFIPWYRTAYLLL